MKLVLELLVAFALLTFSAFALACVPFALRQSGCLPPLKCQCGTLCPCKGKAPLPPLLPDRKKKGCCDDE